MKAEGGGVVGDAAGRGSPGLVLLQVSLSFILLTGVGLLLAKSLRAMRDTGAGFPAASLLVSGVDMISAGYDLPRIRAFRDQFVERVQRPAGVESMVWTRGI